VSKKRQKSAIVRRSLTLVAGIAMLCAMQLQLVSAATVTHQSIAVPMYEYPTIGTYWSDIIGAANSHLPFVVVDDANGTFTSADPNYTNQINTNTAANVRSIGYVHSDYQVRNFQNVYDDIDSWYQHYPGISGIFVDLVQNGSAADQCYMSLLTQHVKNTHPNDLVILNFGANVSPAYEPYGDIFMNAENDYTALSTLWTVGYPGFEDNPAYENRFWQIAHTTSPGNYAAALNMLKNRNAGWVYITDDTMPNPYHLTPTYWSTEVNDITTGLPPSTIPNRGKSPLPAGCQDLTATPTNSTTTGAKKVTTASNITVANGSSLYKAEPSTKINFSMPAGVTLASGTGTGWICNTTTGACSYAASINASQSSAVLGASFDASCDYTSGNVTGTLTNFAGNTSAFTVAPTRPADCAVAAAATEGTLANTGLPTGVMSLVAGGLAVGAMVVYHKRRAIHYRLSGFSRR
jgi:hypothetical protein